MTNWINQAPRPVYAKFFVSVYDCSCDQFVISWSGWATGETDAENKAIGYAKLQYPSRQVSELAAHINIQS
jgi:hypothetical protein